MEVKVMVILQADADDPSEVPEPDEIVSACVEAVDNAIQLSEGAGFSHRLANSISIGLVEVTAE